MQRLVHLEQCFPNLASAGYEKTSEATGRPPAPGAYNCIAWAAHDNHRWWWPEPDAFWPSWARRQPTVACFAQAFRRLGYRKCSNSRREFGYEKVALYAMHNSGVPVPATLAVDHFDDWEPKHMARQLPDGTWTSKAGGSEDLTHFTLDAVECFGPTFKHGAVQYGSPIFFMKRLVFVSWVVRILQAVQWHSYGRWRY